ncbi:sensor histidine kinase [Neptunomonas antarctica]|uniref:histidine kinase n=1 Tax=Neptunomonas antarctica TaxID=619304 RepID=A0A1N7L6H2_9GAMM|nr:HAMP domain-containing sensor histidine kinase [Neptunomonas antarctica]SIS69465.1 Histidine kinase-, DNA gyrase B-, and HSP90-like ATPase [Neptunomonas antarctica]
MKRRTPLILAVIIALPLLLLAWFGVRFQLDQQQVAAHQLSNLVTSRLQSIDQQFQEHFFLLQQRFILRADALQQETEGRYSVDSVRRFIGQSAAVKQIFVLSESGDRLFPPQDQPLNLQEQDFVALTRNLLSAPERFTLPVLDPTASTPPQGVASQGYSGTSNDEIQSARLNNSVSQKARYSADISAPALSASAQERAAERPHGWIAWYAEAGLQQIFWLQDSEGNTVGFALNSSRLLSDLINLLPSSVVAGSDVSTEQKAEQKDEQETDSEIRLINDRGELAYSWGSGEGGQVAEAGKKPLQTLPLSHPLASWHLAYYAADMPAVITGWLGLFALLLLLAVGLSTLAYLLYREHNREMRVAEQRVNFVNQVTHELKTPLTNVRLYTEMLEQELPEDDVVAQRYLGIIGSEAGRLSRLIENVLSFSRLKRGHVRIRYQQGVVDTCIAQVVELFTPVLSTRKLQIRFTGKASHLCHFDSEIVEQILNNLLSNCEKYAADGQFVDISSWQEDSSGRLYSYIRVSDFGPGVSVDESEKLFEPFYRGSDKLTEGVSGTGIGLGLARDLARAHQGDLMVEQLSPTDVISGASFLLSLATPLTVPAMTAVPPMKAEKPDD